MILVQAKKCFCRIFRNSNSNLPERERKKRDDLRSLRRKIFVSDPSSLTDLARQFLHEERVRLRISKSPRH